MVTHRQPRTRCQHQDQDYPLTVTEKGTGTERGTEGTTTAVHPLTPPTPLPLPLPRIIGIERVITVEEAGGRETDTGQGQGPWIEDKG